MWFGMTSEAGRVLGVVFGDVRGREGRPAWFWAWEVTSEAGTCGIHCLNVFTACFGCGLWVCRALGVRLLIVFIACFGCGLWVFIQ